MRIFSYESVIHFAVLSVCFLYPIGTKFCVGPHMTQGKVYGCSELKNSDFCIILKIHEDRVVNLQFFYDCFIEQKCWMIEQQLKFKIEVGLEAA